MRWLALLVLLPALALGQSTTIQGPNGSGGRETAKVTNTYGLQVDVTRSPVSLDTVNSGVTLGALNAAASVALAGQQGVGVAFTTGCTATATPELSIDGGTTWTAGVFDAVINNAKTATVVNPATGSQYTIVGVGGASHARVRLSAWTSGTCVATIRSSDAKDPSVLFAGPTATAVPPGIALVGGTNGTNLYGLSVDTSGRPNINLAQINAVTPLMGNGVTGTGSPRVTVASDNTPFTIKVGDGTNTSAVKAASTAAAATDPSLVVNISPNSPVHPVKIDQTTVGTTNAVSLAQVGATTVVNGGVAGTLAVGGNVADGAAAGSMNPLKAAGVVVADGAITAKSAGNLSQLSQDTQGRLLARTYHPNYWTSDISTGASTVTATTQVAGLSGASLSYYITDVILSNGGTAQTVAVVSSTTAGNACATAPANVIPPISLPANGGMAMSYSTPIKVSSNSALCCKISGSTAFSCQLRGFTAP